MVAQGARAAPELIEKVRAADGAVLPEIAWSALLMLGDQLHALALQIEARAPPSGLAQTGRRQPAAPHHPGRRGHQRHGAGRDRHRSSLFRSGREFSAFLGLVPRQKASGGKERLGRISKMGYGYLGKLLVVGATSVIRGAKTGDLAAALRLRSLLERKPVRVVTVAMANKAARIVWAVLAQGEAYRPATAGDQDRSGSPILRSEL